MYLNKKKHFGELRFLARTDRGSCRAQQHVITTHCGRVESIFKWEGDPNENTVFGTTGERLSDTCAAATTYRYNSARNNILILVVAPRQCFPNFLPLRTTSTLAKYLERFVLLINKDTQNKIYAYRYHISIIIFI